MIDYYKITNSQSVEAVEKENANWLILTEASREETQEIIAKFDLPEDIFSGSEIPEEVSRLEKITQHHSKDVYSLVLTNLSNRRELTVEERLEPITFIFTSEYAITYVPQRSNFNQKLLAKYRDKIISPETMVTYAALIIYAHYTEELLKVKQDIDRLDSAARKTTENAALTDLADTERLLVYLDHTLSNQKKTLSLLWEDNQYVERLDDNKLLFDLKLREKHANKLVSLYRDLLETVGGLFSDMMSNNLNHLMKYLDSAALILSIPALITGLWGMNIGGMPGQHSNIAFFMVIGVSFISAILMAIYLSKRDYSK